MRRVDLSDVHCYLALNGRLATAGQPTPEQLIRVARAGYRVVINLATHDSAGALAAEAVLVKSLGMDYIHIPVRWDAPSPADFALFGAAMARYRREALFVHCIANKRVSVFVMLHRILHLGWPLTLAQGDLWHVWQPEGVWQAFIERVVGS